MSVAASSLKTRVAVRLVAFLDHYATHALRDHSGVDPSASVGPRCVLGRDVKIGRRTYLDADVRVDSGTIGAFCSIGPGVRVGLNEHPLQGVSTHPFWYGDWLPQRKDAPLIGNDVWLGAGVQVLRGADVEDGAVVGAGAIVTSTIPAYAVAVGVPARVIRYRFTPAIAAAVRRTRWWTWPDAQLEEMKDMFSDPVALLAWVGALEQVEAEA